MERADLIKVFAEVYKESIGVTPCITHNDEADALTMMCTISDGLFALHKFGYVSGEDVLWPLMIIRKHFNGDPQEKNISEFLESVLSIIIVANRYLWDNEKIAALLRSIVDQEEYTINSI